jgi:hypothetical protein
MAELRFKKYATAGTQTAQQQKKGMKQGCRRTVVSLLVLAILAIVLVGLAMKAPIKNSLSGVYSPPASFSDIPPYSRARWLLHDAHAAQLATDIAWYNRSKLAPPKTADELDSAGFRPFVFHEPGGAIIQVTEPGAIQSPFGLAIVSPEGTASGYMTRRSVQNTSLAGQKSVEVKDETVIVDPKTDTSLHGQFLPDSPTFAEEYACFLADAWDAAVARFVAIYHRPPTSLGELLDGVGLEPNPDSVWPLSGSPGVRCEGGIIDGKIAYWTVTLSGGATRGQARYYDTYDTSYDDSATPENITTSSGSSPVADPGLIEGHREVMFSLSMIKDLIESAKPEEESTESGDSGG